MATPRASKPFTDTMLAALPLGAKITDSRAQGLAARRLKGGVTFEWRGRIRGDKATVRLGIWCPDRELPPPKTEAERHFRMTAAASPGLLSLDLKELPGLLTLTHARAVAAKITAEVRAGKDPRVERRAYLASTVGGALDRFEAEHQQHKRHGAATMALLRKHLARHLGQPIAELKRSDVRAIIKPYADANRWARAHRVKQDVAAFLSWCENEEIIDGFVSPARRLKMAQPMPTRAHVPTLETCRAVYEAAEHLDPKTRVFVRLLLLGAFRRGEVGGLRWSEINGEKIVIPAERTKQQREHTLPLTDAMRAELALLPCKGDRVFGGLNHARIKSRAAKASGTSGWTFHDMRRALATHLGDIGVLPHVIDRILGHALPGVSAIYNRAQLERLVRDALLTWEGLVVGAVEPMGQRDAAG